MEEIERGGGDGLVAAASFAPATAAPATAATAATAATTATAAATAIARIAIAEGKTLKTSAACITVAARTEEAKALAAGLADFEHIFGSTEHTLKKDAGSWFVPHFQVGPTMKASETKHTQLESFTVCMASSRDIAAAKAAAVEAASAAEAAASGRGRRSRARQTIDLVDVVGIRDKGGTKESYPHAPVPILDLVDRLRSANAGLINGIRSSGMDGADIIADGLFRAVAFQVHYGPSWAKEKSPDLGTHLDNESGLLVAVLTIQKGRSVTVGMPPTKELASLTTGHLYAMTAASLDHGHQYPETLSREDASISVVMRVLLPEEKKATVMSWNLDETSKALAGLLEEHGIRI